VSDIDVLVLGGGISGLSVARRLAAAGAGVEVWEQSSRPGGLIGTDVNQGYRTERAATMLLNFRPDVTRFITEAGLDTCKTMRADTAQRYVVSDGRLVPLPMKLGPLLRSPIWSSRAKLRLMLEPLVRGRCHDDETVSDFISRRLGREVLDKTIATYVSGLLASDPDRANAREVLPRLVALESRYGSIAMGILAHRLLRRKTATVTEAFSFTNGMSTLATALTAPPGLNLRLRYRALELEQSAGGWKATAETPSGCRSVSARHVVLSIPAPAAAGLLSACNDRLAGLLAGIDYAPLAVVHTGFERQHVRHPLDGNGFLSKPTGTHPLNGCLWMSSVFPDHAPAARVLLSSYLGGAMNPQAPAWPEHELIDRTLAALAPMLGIRGDPEFVRIVRHARGLPLYHGAYHARMNEVTAELSGMPGLHISANYRGGISVRDRIACSMSLSSLILQQLDRATSTSYHLPDVQSGPRSSFAT